MIIEYIIEFQEKEKIFYTIDTQRNKSQKAKSINRSKWTELDYCKCGVCSLSDTIKYCPAALDIHDVLLLFDKVNSYDFVTVRVRTPLRTYYKECDSQTALGSLIGAIMASSTCPVLSRLKYMAEFHQPFNNLEETLIRTMGFYLIKQYLVKNKGGIPDFELKGLTQLYIDLQNVNYSLKNRLTHAFTADASVNAIAQYFSLSALIEKSLEEQISEISYIFD